MTLAASTPDRGQERRPPLRGMVCDGRRDWGGLARSMCSGFWPVQVSGQPAHPYNTHKKGAHTMGLDTSHGAWHGAYSAFTRWRHQIAETAGYEVARVKFKDGWESDTIMIDWGHLPDGTLMGDWDETPGDPLLVLIAHSDCEGVIHPAQAGPLADRLEELIPLLDEDWGGGHIGNGREKTQTFVDGLRAAAEADEDLDFY